MEYKMQAGEGRIEAAQRPVFRGKSGQGSHRRAQGLASAGKNGTIQTGPTVVVQSGFQAFLADEQNALGAIGKAATPTVTPSLPSPEAADNPPLRQATMHTLRPGETVWELARERYQVEPAAVLRCNGIADPGKLRAGREIRIPAGEQCGIARGEEEVVAGWYGTYHQGRLMANGRRFDMQADTIAHRTMPIGTRVELENPQTGQKAEAVVADRGPFHRGRDIDLSYGLAKQLSLTKQGVGTLKMRVL